MSEVFDLLERYDIKPIGRCPQCTTVYGKERSELLSALRCPHCDFPFGETFEAVRAIALSLQDPKQHMFVNVYAQPVCYIWLHVVRDYMDLTVEPYTADTFGAAPEWFHYEMDNTSWPDVISPERKNRWETDDFTGTWNDWALAEGLCPGQPFLVEFKKPCWSKSGYEYEEWDVEYYWEIVARASHSPKQAARAWDQWIKRCSDDRRARRRQAARDKHKREHDVSAMYIRYDSFWIDRYGDDYPPDGYIVGLWTTHGGGQIASGRSPARSWPREETHPSQEHAWMDLLADIAKRLAHLDPAVIRKLPTRW